MFDQFEIISIPMYFNLFQFISVYGDKLDEKLNKLKFF